MSSEGERLIQLTGKENRVMLRLGDDSDIQSILQYFTVNAAHLEPWEPVRPSGFLAESFWKNRLSTARQEAVSDQSLRLFIFEHSEPQKIIGVANLSQIFRGAFHAAYLGYSIDAGYEGRGFMREALLALLDHAFGFMNLHRIMANYLPQNTRSASLLKSLGFEIEGEAKAYLRIHGKWQDHVLTARTNKQWRNPDST